MLLAAEIKAYRTNSYPEAVQPTKMELTNSPELYYGPPRPTAAPEVDARTLPSPCVPTAPDDDTSHGKQQFFVYHVST